MTRGWKIFWCAMGGAGVLSVCTAWYIEHLINKRWHEYYHHSCEMEESLQSDVSNRPVLYGDTLPGNAWDEYWAAVGQLTPHDFGGFGWNGEGPSPIKDACVAKYSQCLEFLKRGSHALDKGMSPTHRGANPWEFWRLAELGLWSAQDQAEAGKTGEAVRTALDTLQLACDLDRRSTTESATASIRDALLCLQRLIETRPGHFREDRILEPALEILETNLPASQRLMAKRLFSLRQNLYDGVSQPWWRNRSGWRSLFSRRLQVSVRMDELESAVALEQQRPATSLGGLMTGLNARDQELDGSRYPIQEADHFFGHDLGIHGSFALNLGLLRVLRVALRYLNTGDILQLADPFGGGWLETTQDGASLIICSVGTPRPAAGRRLMNSRVRCAVAR